MEVNRIIGEGLGSSIIIVADDSGAGNSKMKTAMVIRAHGVGPKDGNPTRCLHCRRLIEWDDRWIVLGNLVYRVIYHRDCFQDENARVKLPLELVIDQ